MNVCYVPTEIVGYNLETKKETSTWKDNCREVIIHCRDGFTVDRYKLTEKGLTGDAYLMVNKALTWGLIVDVITGYKDNKGNDIIGETIRVDHIEPGYYE